MTDLEVNQGVNEACKISKEIADLYVDNEALVAKLNSIPKNELDQTSSYYITRSGVIVDLRKEVLKFLDNTIKSKRIV